MARRSFVGATAAIGFRLFCDLAQAQIDPIPRELVQLGYNASFQGHAPLSAYAFYYRNQPEWVRTNWTLRAALAPTYFDGELGIQDALGANTDLGLGLAGGGFGDSYTEIRSGKFWTEESFIGHGGELSASLYHQFNPGAEIPLYGLLRGTGHYSAFVRDSQTAPNFTLPDDLGVFSIRTGLRWGGREPILFPSLAMELSIWYQGEFRTAGGDVYGYGDRRIKPASHLFWGEALLAYTLPECGHSFYVSLTAGTSLEVDRFSAYRMGALLPLAAEYPLSLPGYYYQEISARDFILLGGNYIIPLDRTARWNLDLTAATAGVDYIPGFKQTGNWHSGVGAGVFYSSPSWRVMLGYAYGIDAMRDGGRGAHSIGILVQLDLTHARDAFLRPEPNRWRGFQRVLGVLGS